MRVEDEDGEQEHREEPDPGGHEEASATSEEHRLIGTQSNKKFM